MSSWPFRMLEPTPDWDATTELNRDEYEAARAEVELPLDELLDEVYREQTDWLRERTSS